MLLRIAALSYDSVHAEVLDSARLALGLESRVSKALQSVVEFLEMLEQDLSILHLKVLLSDTSANFKKPTTPLIFSELSSHVV